jgi:SpoVK/Ycf46/Vps4 family AAA+-type ATPase
MSDYNPNHISEKACYDQGPATFVPAKAQHSDKIVLDYDGHLEFPSARAYNEVPAGIYYPAKDNNGRFVLQKMSPARREDLDLEEHEGFLRELRDLLEEDEVESGTSYRSNEMHLSVQNNATDFLDHGYFPMEQYHVGLEKVEKSITAFLSSKEMYKTNRLGYKRSVLLYGDPGTGKSRYIDNLSRRLIREKDAIVIRIETGNELMNVLSKGLLLINKVMRNRLKVFVIEELATLIRGGGYTEVLNLLDNALLRDDVIFLMTTNNPENIPSNIVDRPSRVDLLTPVNCDKMRDGFIEAWYKHLLNEDMPTQWKSLPFYTQKLSPAYLKELFISMKLNGVDIKRSWQDIEERRRLVKAAFRETGSIGFM